MKRHDSMIPLTHDHHHALAQARRLRVAAPRDAVERRFVVERFLAFFDSDTRTHFREEEEVIFPLVVDEPAATEPLQRLLVDHVRIHATVNDLRSAVSAGDVPPETMQALSSLLEDHIRFEEKTFFPLVEDLAAARLDTVTLAERNRSPSG